MGVYIKIPNVTFKKYIGIAEIEDEPIVPDVPDEPVLVTIDDYPVKDSTLKGLYDLSGTQTEAIKDHSGNGNDATVVGTGVTFEGNFAHFTGANLENHIATGVSTSVANKTTIVALFRVPTGARSIVSNYSSTKGFNFTNKMVYIEAVSNGGSKTFNDTTVGANGFAICAVSVDANGLRAVKYNNGALDELVSATTEPKACSTDFRIGGSPATTNPANDADIALVAIHEGAMTEAQLESICEFVKTYGEQNGLTIE